MNVANEQAEQLEHHDLVHGRTYSLRTSSKRACAPREWRNKPPRPRILTNLLKQPFWGISQLLQHSVVRLLLLSFIHNDGCYKVALLTLFTELTITVTTSTALDCNCNCNWFTSHVSFMGSTSWSVRSLSNCQFLNFTLTSEPAQFA